MKCSYAALNDFMRVWTDLCNRKCSSAAGNDFMQVWTDLCDMKCSYAALNDFMRVWTDLCNRKCSYAARNNFMRLWTNLCNWICFCETNCCQELHFEFSRQNLNRNVQSPSVWWWLITQPRPIWKKTPPGLQRPSHAKSRIPGHSLWPPWPDPHLRPNPRHPWGLVPPFPFDY